MEDWPQETIATELKEVTGDPWCIGFFVDNELHWGSTRHLGEATIASPATQPPRRVFLDDLQRKCAETISAVRQTASNLYARRQRPAAPDRARNQCAR
jgi:hypothetical protein